MEEIGDQEAEDDTREEVEEEEHEFMISFSSRFDKGIPGYGDTRLTWILRIDDPFILPP